MLLNQMLLWVFKIVELTVSYEYPRFKKIFFTFKISSSEYPFEQNLIAL